MKRAGFVLLILVLVAVPAAADLGPKPSVVIELEYAVEDNISVVGGDIYACRAGNCTVGKNISLRAAGWRSSSYLGFTCQQGKCDAINYGDGRQLLVLELSDGTRRIAPFRQYAFDSRFIARIQESGMELERGSTSSSSRDALFLVAVMWTVLLELPVGILFLMLYTGTRLTALSRRLITSLAGVSLVTLPLLWFVFPLLRSHVAPATIALTGELSAIVIEGLLLARINPDQLTTRTGLVVAAVMNATTVALGLLWVTLT